MEKLDHESFFCKYVTAPTLLKILVIVHIVFSSMMIVVEQNRNKKEGGEETDQIAKVIDTLVKLIVNFTHMLTRSMPTLPWIISCLVCVAMLYLINNEISMKGFRNCEKPPAPPSAPPAPSSAPMNDTLSLPIRTDLAE